MLVTVEPSCGGQRTVDSGALQCINARKNDW